MTKAPPIIRWGLIDRAVALISPRAASQRYAARIALGNLRRAYDGSAKGRGTDGWTTSGKAADAEIGVARQPSWPVPTTTLAGGAERKTGMPVWRAAPPA
ncbi:hypothetical protein RNZ50_26275 [Paracoccaceae bacterium Fryx2]|nr:hypothetical protein [Paracoccaceae bacterium Fryx2]